MFYPILAPLVHVAFLLLALAAGVGAQEAAPAVRSSPDPAWLAEQHRLAESRPAPRPSGFWKASVAALVAGSFADIHSSLGKHELNPLLANSSGRFSGRGIAIKSAITGGALAVQWLLVRKNPAASNYAAAANFAMAGVFARAAVRNYGIPAAPIPPARNPAP